MEYFGKSKVNEILKNHNYKAIESDKPGRSWGSNMPYRTWDGKVLKGIWLFRTSPVTFTNAGRENGKEKVDKLLNDFMKIGAVKRLSEFGFVVCIPESPTKCIVVKGELDSRDGIEYDQTFHFLQTNVESKSIKEFDINSFKSYEDGETEQHALTNAYLDYLLK